MRDCLRAGVLREWRVEKLLEALLVIYTTPANDRRKADAQEQAIEYALRTFTDMVSKIDDPQVQLKQLQFAIGLISRQVDALEKRVALSGADGAGAVERAGGATAS